MRTSNRERVVQGHREIDYSFCKYLYAIQRSQYLPSVFSDKIPVEKVDKKWQPQQQDMFQILRR